MSEPKEPKVVTKAIMDLNTRVPYFISVSEDGKTLVDISGANDGVPVFPNQENKKTAAGDPIEPPFGKKMYAVDISGSDTGSIDIYTIVWPSKEDLVNNKAMPAIAKNTLPADLIDMGIAKLPDSLKTKQQISEESEQEIVNAMSTINELVGLQNVKDKLRNQIALTRFSALREEILGSSAKKPSLHMVFTGNPGTGKTTVAREYGKVLKAMGLLENGELHEVKREDLVGAVIGKSEEKTAAVLEKAKGGVLFIDEAYSLVVPGSSNDFGKVVIDQLVAAMENMRDDLVLIVAGYPDPMKQFINSNPGLKSRFLNYIEFPDFDKNEVGQIIDYMTKGMDIKMTPNARKEAIAVIEDQRQKNGKNFGNGRTVRNLLDLSFENAALRVMEGKTMDELRALDKKKLEKLVSTIRLDDVKSANLDGINSKKGNIGFNTNDDEEDDVLPPSQAPSQAPTAFASDFAANTAKRFVEFEGENANDDRKIGINAADRLRARFGMGK